MSAAAVLPPAPGAPLARGPHPLLGRTFLGPLFDYLVIGGGASLLVALGLAWDRARVAALVDPSLPHLLVAVGYAHFAASTLRLYTKPGATAAHPFLAFVLPLACLGVLTFAVARAAEWGRLLNVLYLGWSPFHYSAQAYGLAVIYAHRSGCALLAAEKKLLRWSCLPPFLKVTLLATVPRAFFPELLARDAALAATLDRVGALLTGLAWLAPVALFAAVWRRRREPPPAMVLLLLVSNAAWLLVFGQSLDAFPLGAMAHGLQYLAIALVYHVREGRRQPPLRSAAGFYAACLPLGYVLFQVWPWTFMAAGFGRVESVMLVTAMVNIHHFLVDAYVWRRS